MSDPELFPLPTRAERRRDELFAYAALRPHGFTVDEAMVDLDMDHRGINCAIRNLRHFLGDTDSVNLTCDPQGRGERWLYRLVGAMDDVRPWADNRIRDSRTRLVTMTAMMRSVVAATDGRTTEGRLARAMERGLRHLVEDLEAIGS